MDLLNGEIKSVYFKYLLAAFGSAFITSVYSIADMAFVGQYQGPDGTAALAVVAPVWNIIFSLGLLTGIGGSVIFCTARGAGTKEEADEYFSAALIGSIVLSVIVWAAILIFEKQILLFFGADETLLSLAQAYLLPIKFVIPFYLFNQMFAAFLRNDGNPLLAAAGVTAGGIFNIIGDYVFVFPLNMGIFRHRRRAVISSYVSAFHF